MEGEESYVVTKCQNYLQKSNVLKTFIILISSFYPVVYLFTENLHMSSENPLRVVLWSYSSLFNFDDIIFTWAFQLFQTYRFIPEKNTECKILDNSYST